MPALLLVFGKIHLVLSLYAEKYDAAGKPFHLPESVFCHFLQIVLISAQGINTFKNLILFSCF